tara:strand:- start:18042 stop:19562 length:1521 start_codon:yes stop_codon:yes gene_type:complete
MSRRHELRAILRDLTRPRVAIIGDLILDRYVMGDVTRISPEAPIPVLAAKQSELRLGGAGNVAANLRAMEAEIDVVGVVGDDGLGRALIEQLEELGAQVDGIVRDDSRPTIEKTRMLSGVQQMLRVDWEDVRELDGAAAKAVEVAALAAVDRSDAVVISDYGKGLLSPGLIAKIIAACRQKGVPVLVDPKGADYTRYRGATLITPNRKEAEEAVGHSIASVNDVPAAAQELLEAADLDNVLITLSAEGIYYRSKDGTDGRVPAEAQKVYDVTGAGDTVVAHLALYLAAGLELADAVGLANQAAGLVVARLGTHSVTRAELDARLAADRVGAGSKRLDAATLPEKLESWRRQGRRIVFTNGCFDVLHRGHVEYLRFARTLGDALIVGINDDASVRRAKGPTRPVNELDDRMEVLAALEVVDGVMAFEDDTPLSLIQTVTPDVLVKGEDWRDKGVVGTEWVESHGGRVVLAPLLAGRSTTATLERAKRGQGVAADGGSPSGGSEGQDA